MLESAISLNSPDDTDTVARFAATEACDHKAFSGKVEFGSGARPDDPVIAAPPGA
jgi:hypothetical protein